jgi:hypothetical protein
MTNKNVGFWGCWPQNAADNLTIRSRASAPDAKRTAPSPTLDGERVLLQASAGKLSAAAARRRRSIDALLLFSPWGVRADEAFALLASVAGRAGRFCARVAEPPQTRANGAHKKAASSAPGHANQQRIRSSSSSIGALIR